MTFNIQAHEGAIIAVRPYGWGDVRTIKMFDLINGFTLIND